MCLAIPGQIVELEGSAAVVSVGGVTRAASVMLLEEAAIGDWVLLHAGFAIERLDPDEAEKTLALFRELAEADAADPR